MNSETLRDTEGRAKQYTTPERAEKDAERLRTKQPELCVWIRWLPVPLRPWRVCFEVAS